MVTITDIMSYCKRKGLVFPSSEIYGGFAGFYDYGPVGVEIVNNIKNEWWNSTVRSNENVVGINGTIIGHPKIWEASGHVANFVDYLVECKKCKQKFRADHLIEDILKIKTEGLKTKELGDIIKKEKIKCPSCKGELGSVAEFNLMFKTNVGPSGQEFAYLRPETAQTIFVDFKSVLDTTRQKLPFGIAQIGKAFRNEISPRNFLFRLREFEQMEMEFFVHPEKKNDCEKFDSVKEVKVNALTTAAQEKDGKVMPLTIGELVKAKTIKSKWHAFWIGYRYKWFLDLGIKPHNLRIRQHVKTELSHYAADTWDIEYNYEFGWKELEGIADRTDFDLKQHAKVSGQDISYFDEETKERVIPHVAAEPSLGVDRAFLTFILDAYHEEEVKGEKRIVLKLNPRLAPFKAAIFPLVNKEGMDKKAKEIYETLQTKFATFYDDSGSIGRRYRRMDEIGTPFCITIDGQTMEDNTVTLRDRDSLKQVRIKTKELHERISKLLDGEKP
jgi:glycyl-tRNA synthetase